MSFTVTLTSKSNILTANFFPPIELNSNDDYQIALLSFDSYNTIPNIITNVCDKFYIGNKIIQIPEGSYDIESIEEFLNSFDNSLSISLRGNTNTLKCELECSDDVYFNFPDKPHSIGPLLGFTTPNLTLKSNKGPHHSVDIVNIMKVNVLSIHCNVAGGSYINGMPDHVIHAFFPTTPPGFKIVETPSPVIYHSINVRSIENITLRVLDQEGDLVNFRGETITIRLHIKRNGD